MENLRLRLARKLVALRGDKSQLQYSKEIGLSNSTLRRLEDGTQNLTLDSLQILCERLGCDVVELFREDDARARSRRR